MTLALSAILFPHSPAKAQQKDTPAFFSGAYLLKLCELDKKGKETVKGGRAACQTYIAGIIDYHKLLRSLDTSPSIDFCVPNTVKLNDLQTLVWTYLSANPQHDAFNAAPAVSLALYSAYACPK